MSALFHQPFLLHPLPLHRIQPHLPNVSLHARELQKLYQSKSPYVAGATPLSIRLRLQFPGHCQWSAVLRMQYSRHQVPLVANVSMGGVNRLLQLGNSSLHCIWSCSHHPCFHAYEICVRWWSKLGQFLVVMQRIWCGK